MEVKKMKVLRVQKRKQCGEKEERMRKEYI